MFQHYALSSNAFTCALLMHARTVWSNRGHMVIASWLHPSPSRRIGVVASDKIPHMGCDIHTHAHAQTSLQNVFVEQMGTAGSLYNFFGQWYGYEHHSSAQGGRLTAA